MNNLHTQKVIDANQVFDNSFIEARSLYLYHFEQLPNLHHVGYIDGEKAYKAFCEKFKAQVAHTYTYRWYKHKKKAFQFDRTIAVLNNKCIVAFDDDYCEIMHDGRDMDFIHAITALVNRFKERTKKQPLEINLIISNGKELQLKAMEIKKTKLDLDLYYDDAFSATDQIIRKRLNQKNDKGIVLLHGLPGTGKTTYLRYLIGNIKKRVLFLSPSVADNLMNPDFIELMIRNPNTVLVIEDAENIIMDRKYSSGSSVSNLLNISDGLLADFLNVQLICTFNSSLTMIDSALMRKGRLIAKHEFGKLSIEKAQKLSNHLGFGNLIDVPMTIAEIANQNERNFEKPQKNSIGFKRLEEMMV